MVEVSVSSATTPVVGLAVAVELAALVRSARLETAYDSGIDAAWKRDWQRAVPILEPVVDELPPAQRGWAGLALARSLKEIGRGSAAAGLYRWLAADEELEERFRTWARAEVQ